MAHYLPVTYKIFAVIWFVLMVIADGVGVWGSGWIAAIGEGLGFGTLVVLVGYAVHDIINS